MSDPTTPPPATAPTACTKNSDCTGSNQVCCGGVCTTPPTCTSDSDCSTCASNGKCVSGVCSSQWYAGKYAGRLTTRQWIEIVGAVFAVAIIIALIIYLSSKF